MNYSRFSPMACASLPKASTKWQAVGLSSRKRNRELPRFKKGFSQFLPDIAVGRLLPEAVVAFLESHTVTRHIRGIPLDRQKELADGANVRLYDSTSGETLQMPILNVPCRLVPQIFTNGIERTPEEQRAAIRGSRPATAAKKKYHIVVDRKTSSLKIGNTVVPIIDVMSAMARASGCVGVIDYNRHATEQMPTVVGQLTNTEKEAVRTATKLGGVTESEYVRLAVMAFTVR